MRSTLLATLFTLSIASLSFARIIGITAPSTVKKDASFPVTFQTGDFRQNEDYAAIVGFSSTPCNTCIGTPAATFDLAAQGRTNTTHGSFTETLKAPTTPGKYDVTATIVYTSTDPNVVGLRFLTTFPRITVT
ncbi:hypothetical protein FRB97_007624 [Tulasnella sp. 331]|nr:hypothetical protein FRB97_007624 [Tulasnella sp. 331]